LCEINGAQYCCAEDKPFCFINEDGQYACGVTGFLCNGKSMESDQICCGANGEEEWACDSGRVCGSRVGTCPVIGTTLCEGATEDGDLFSCREGTTCCYDTCCSPSQYCDETDDENGLIVYSCKQNPIA
jgi:hypothetical protein